RVGTDRIGQHETRECLLQHVKQKFCHGRKAAKEMSIIDIHHSLIVRYSLESVCERRQLCWTFEPFVDHDDDTMENQVPYPHSHQPVDDPWKIPKIFQDQCMEVTVPGTVSIHSCHICAGVGRKRCLACVGSGSTKCDICEGVGFYGIDHNKPAFTRTFSANSDNNNDYCWRCRGRGRLRCDGCSGVGMTACIGCAGSGQIKCYIKMIVTL
ncbi:hypothetical protein BLA29_002244, partial [Euroglyphus maynei]